MTQTRHGLRSGLLLAGQQQPGTDDGIGMPATLKKVAC